MILSAYLILENLDGKNLKNQPIYSFSIAEYGMKSCRDRLRKICGSGRRLNNFIAEILDTKPMADAMASWKTPWVQLGWHGKWRGHGKCHAPVANATSSKRLPLTFFVLMCQFSPLLAILCSIFWYINSYLENTCNKPKIPT